MRIPPLGPPVGDGIAGAFDRWVKRRGQAPAIIARDPAVARTWSELARETDAWRQRAADWPAPVGVPVEPEVRLTRTVPGGVAA
ncbi:MAG: hypothetical protein AAGN46_14740, partial [Acidobacteriota bacterium]